MKYISISLAFVSFIIHLNLCAQSTRQYKFDVDSVQVFETPSPVNGFYLPPNISSLNKPLYAEPFASNVSFPNSAQDIFPDAGNYVNTIFGGDVPGVLGFGFTATTTIINDTFSTQDFPILLEADFFNRSSFGNYNESYFWLGNSNYTNFNPSTSILPSANVQQGIIIGGLPERSIVSHGRSFLLPSVALVNSTHNFAEYNRWYKLKVLLDVTDDERLVIYNIFIDDNCVMANPLIVEKAEDLNLNSFKLAICVDDFAKEFNVTKNETLFQLPNIVACKNEIITLSADFDEELCLDLSYIWNLPESNIGFSTAKFISNLKYENPGDYSATVTISNGQFVKTIPFKIIINEGPSKIISQQLCANDSIYFNNQWLFNSGLYQQVLTGQDGCDSTITLDLIFQDTVKSFSQIDLCQGDSLQINGQWIYEGGNFSVFSTTTSGCDSVLSIRVDLIPQLGVFDTINLCQGDSVFLNNRWYFDEQVVSYFDLNSLCPINVTTSIVGQPVYRFNEDITICPADSINYQGNWINSRGEYFFRYKTQQGCDSIYVLNASQVQSPDLPLASPDCENSYYELSVDVNADWSFVWSNGGASSPTLYMDDTMASISYRHSDTDCWVNYNISLPPIPHDDEVPLFSDTLVYPGKPLKYMVGLDASLWSLDWYQEDKLSCEGCLELMINTQFSSQIDLIFNHISGCAYYRNFNIDIDASQDLFIPNIFAPERSSFNNNWSVWVPDCFEVEYVRIYDRWGNLITLMEYPEAVFWNGLFKGRMAEQGVYTYIIYYKNPDGVMKYKTGDVTLLR